MSFSGTYQVCYFIDNCNRQLRLSVRHKNGVFWHIISKLTYIQYKIQCWECFISIAKTPKWSNTKGEWEWVLTTELIIIHREDIPLRWAISLILGSVFSRLQSRRILVRLQQMFTHLQGLRRLLRLWWWYWWKPPQLSSHNPWVYLFSRRLSLLFSTKTV